MAERGEELRRLAFIQGAEAMRQAAWHAVIGHPWSGPNPPGSGQLGEAIRQVKVSALLSHEENANAA